MANNNKQANNIRRAAILVFFVSVFGTAALVFFETRDLDASKIDGSNPSVPDDSPTSSPPLRSSAPAGPTTTTAAETTSTTETTETTSPETTSTTAPVDSSVNDISNAFDPVVDYFRLKMQWLEGYDWWENSVDTAYCVECASCTNLTFTPSGEELCERSECALESQIWLADCNDESGLRGEKFQALPSLEFDGFSQLSIVGTDLCLERTNKRFIVAQTCNTRIQQQRFHTPSATSMFEWTPFNTTRDEEPYCASQFRKPRAYNVIGFTQCTLAHTFDSAFWTTDFSN